MTYMYIYNTHAHVYNTHCAYFNIVGSIKN